MENILQRMVENLFSRLDGPLHFRFIVQPLMAVILAVISGVKDAKMDKPPYFWAVVTDSAHRKDFLKDGWKHVGKILILAAILDVFYQLKVQRMIYPGEMLVVAFTLAVVPYLLLRGTVNRLLRPWKKK